MVALREYILKAKNSSVVERVPIEGVEDEDHPLDSGRAMTAGAFDWDNPIPLKQIPSLQNSGVNEEGKRRSVFFVGIAANSSPS